MSLLQLQAGFGLLALTALAWALGGFRRGVTVRVVAAGLGLQVVLAALMLHVSPFRTAFALVGRAVDALARATASGTALVFGYLGGAPPPFEVVRPEAAFVLFFQALPLVLVVGAISAVLYHWRVLPLIVALMARGLRRAFGLGGACGFSVAANVFVGMVEAPLLIRAWLARLSRSELFVVMTAGLATISGNTLVVYATFIAPVVPDAAGQLLTASLVSAPAAVLAALLMLPPRPDDAAAAVEEVPASSPRLYDSTMEAIVRGTGDGLTLLLGIMASLIVFVALVALANEIIAPLGGITLQRIASWIFWPLAWAMGVPVSEAGSVARSLGIKVVINEFVAYLELGQSGGTLAERTRLILTYALCGFANLGSLGIMVGGLSAMVPERRADIVEMAPKAVLIGLMATLLSAALVGTVTWM